MNLLFMGVQGSGKGTQAKIIASKLNLIHISTGDLLRDTKGELKEEVNLYMASGKLVPDKLIIKILKNQLKEESCKNGVILDGFPRNLEQAEEADKIMKIDKAVEIAISNEEAIKRLAGRWNCKKCSNSYNLITSLKPKKNGICDICGRELYQRKDDIKEEAVKKRLETYHKETKPVLKHYSSVKINGEQSIEKVTRDIINSLK